ncbi:MAG: glycosyl hydrolase family 5 [Alteromonadaceae bacterium]|nr:MAG: glycosyl hydrolase family 5 [Alteromonadaceae bacterium]
MEATSDTGGGLNVGWTESGEWLEFDTSIPPGTYNVRARVASLGGGNISISVGNSILAGNVPDTGDWQNWQDLNLGEITLTSNANEVTINFDSANINLNWIDVRQSCSSDPSCTDTDGDGVADSIDACPNTPANTPVGSDGCELPGGNGILAQTAAQQMGTGFNIGQVFESDDKSRDFNTTKGKIDAYYALGFRNVRIPVSWTIDIGGNKLVNPGTGVVDRNHPRLAVITQVIDYALSLPDMYVIINAHHESPIKDGNQWQVLEQIWNDVSDIYKDRDYHLIYEILNEPHLSNGSAMPASNLRNMTGKAYEKIRQADPERLILIGGNQWFHADEMAHVWPNLNEVGNGQDQFIIATFHHYDPWDEFHFEDTWPKNFNFTDNTVFGPMETMINWSNSVGNGMPIHIGEWGVGWGKQRDTMNCNNIRLWYQKFGDFSSQRTQPTSVWDDGGWFKVFDYENQSFNNNLAQCAITGNCNWDTSARMNSGCF